VPKREGLRLSARTLDDPASGPPGPRAWTGGGQAWLARLAQGTVCNVLDQEDVKPRNVRCDLECRDPDFAEKVAEVLCVDRKVKILKKAAAASRRKPSAAVAVICYDEKPGIQAIATPAPG
jgi:hypothetical protein